MSVLFLKLIYHRASIIVHLFLLKFSMTHFKLQSPIGRPSSSLLRILQRLNFFRQFCCRLLDLFVFRFDDPHRVTQSWVLSLQIGSPESNLWTIVDHQNCPHSIEANWQPIAICRNNLVYNILMLKLFKLLFNYYFGAISNR